MLRDVFVYGAAGRECGRHFRLDIASPVEAVRALITLRPRMREIIRNGMWRVIVGTPHLRNSINVDALGMQSSGQAIHLVPAHPPSGGGPGKAIGSIIVGVILVAAAVVSFGTLGFMGAMGVSLILGGIAGLLTPLPEDPKQATDRAKPDDRPSFLFNGVVNNSQQGGPVPLVFGTHLVGSIVVSASITAEDIPV